ncbi:MAG: citronellol/citronellal dehydrogenase [Myxococcota bacterium]|jgi:citronellol/citronellal dehydrogenase
MASNTHFNSIFRTDLFAGQTALVTGGGTGIGRCIAHELAALGAHVIVSGRREAPLEATIAEIKAAGGQGTAQTLDIRDDVAVDETVAKLVAEHGPIHLLVNNAGGQFASPAAMIRPKGWRAVVDTNLNGTWFVSQAVFKHSMSRHRGAICSIVADMWNGFPGMAHTGAARAGVVNLTMTLATEWACAGVRVNAVAPGYILTSGLKTYPPSVQATAKRAFAANPSSRPGTESEVSAVVVFLLSPAAAYVTGDTVRVDGASSLQKTPMLTMPKHARSVAFEGFHLEPDLPDGFAALIPTPKA